MKGKILSMKRYLLSVATTLVFLLFAQSAAAVSYTVIAGDRNDDSNEGLAKLFDGDYGTKWGNGISVGSPQYVIFKVDAAIAPKWYCLVTGTDNAAWNHRGWKTWSIYGTNADIEGIQDNAAKRSSSDWVLIDKKENIGTDIMPDFNSYEVFFNMEKPAEAYVYFKIEIDEIVSGGGYMQMSEFFFSDEAYFKSVVNKRYEAYKGYELPTTYQFSLGTEYEKRCEDMKLKAITGVALTSYCLQLNDMQQQIKVSGELYEAYMQAVASVQDAADKNNLTDEGVAKVRAYVAGTYPAIIGNGELDSDAIKAETATVNSWIELYSNKDLTEGAIEGVTYVALSGRDGFNNESYSNLVDGNDGTKWCTNQGDYFIVIKASEAIAPTYYRLFTSNDTGNYSERNWKSWKIYGGNFASDDAATREAEGWVVLDDKQNSDVLPAKSNTEVFVDMSSPSATPYQYFKLEISDPSGIMQMSEISFLNQANFFKTRQERVAEYEAIDLSAPISQTLIANFEAALDELRHVATRDEMTKAADKCKSLATQVNEANTLYANTGLAVLTGNTAWGDHENWTRLVDGDLTTKWGGGREDGSYLIFRCEAGAAPYYYTLVTGNDTQQNPDRNWADWTIYAANFGSDAEATRDAEGWVEIAKEEGVGQDRLPAANFAHANFDFLTTPVDQTYKYFRVEVPKSYDNGGNIQMTELIFKSEEDFAALKQQFAEAMAKTLSEMGPDIVAYAEKMGYTEALNAVKTVADLQAIQAKVDEVLATFPAVKDGYFQISTPEELAWFATAVNTMGFVSAKAQLTADLDLCGKLADGAPAEVSALFTPIGTTEQPFKGEFDGQNHVFKNLVIDAKSDFVGVFGRIADGAVIKNFVVDANSYIGGASYVGVIAASIGSGKILIDRIGMEGAVVASGINAGGIYGCNMGNPAATVSNCYVTGPVKGQDQSGQINGWLGGGKIENCWAIGSVEGVYNKTEGAGDAFYRGAPTASNNYSNAAAKNAGVNAFSEEDAKSGKMTFALNGNNADGAWYQTIGVDAYPTLNPASKKVYAVPSEGFRCDGQPLGESVYTNEEQTPVFPDHEYENFICKNCGQVDPDFTSHEDDVYSLATPEEFVLFATFVNQGNTAANAKLAADMDMQGYNLPVICPEGSYYVGTFDGQGHKISNLKIETANNYTGLFGVVGPGARIQNFVLDETCSIIGNSYTAIVGGTAGLEGEVYITAVGNEGYVKGYKNAGAIFGCEMGATATVYIDRCFSSGTVEGNNESGALTGFISKGYIYNSWSSAAITGYYTSASKPFALCYCDTKNNYIVHTDLNAEFDIKGITAEQVASGELCYLLNQNSGLEDPIWFQTLSSDSHPVLDNTHGVVYKVNDGYSNSEFADPILLVDGVYQIFTGEGLVQFANIVNGGESDAKAILMADIEMAGLTTTPINNYKGEFDGQGHVIKNFSIEGGDYTGLFGVVNGGAVIKNFTMKNASIKGNAFVGIIGGSNGGGTITMDALGFEGEAIGTAQNVSGIIGVNMSSAASFRISNCYVKGTISGARESAAITGWTGGNQTTITNCWSTAEVSGNDAGKAFYRNDNTIWSNCYNQYGEQVAAIPEGSLADGSMTFVLNGNKADGVWYQTLGKDENPVLTPTSKKVYAVPSEGFRCDGQPLGDITYTNDEQAVEIPDHEYEGFVCKNCGHLNPDYVTPVDGVYSLGTAEELAWFARKINEGGDKALNAVLTSDIDLSAYTGPEYTIGLNNDGYQGTFDGQFHTVNVAYVNNAEGGTEVNHSTALFRFVNGGTIKNIITTGTIESNQKYASGLVGKSQGAGATMENVATYVTINSAVSGDGTHAGFLGVADAPATITNAISGIVINGDATNSCGGLSGWASQPVTFNNCVMIGEINCLDDGSATFSRNPGGNTYNNCYYREGVKELQDNGNVTKVTAAQLASGEVCYLLNGDQSEPVFFQTLGEDAYPVLDSTHGVVYKIGETYTNSASSPTNLPLMSTADEIHVYTIKNLRSGKYVNYAGDSRMTQTPEITENSYFYFMADGETEGTFTPVRIYNVAAGKAMNEITSWGVGTKWYINRDLNIYTTGLSIGRYTRVGDNGLWWNDASGAGQYIGTWNANGDTGSVFAIEPVDAPADMVTYVVDYKLNGEVVYTAPYATTNAEFAPAAPLYSTVVSTEADGTKITANFEVNAPFEASTKDAPVWYYLKQRAIENYNHYAFYTDAETNMTDVPDGAKFMFAFIGDPINGYDIINYAGGKDQYWVIEGAAGNGSAPVWSETPRKWELGRKDDTYFGFGVTGYWMNNYGGGDSRTLKLWQSGPTGDNGSTLSVEAVPAEDLAAIEVGFDWDPAPIELTGDYEIVSSLSAINGTSTTGAISLVGTPKATVKNFNTNETIEATLEATGTVLTMTLAKVITDHAVVYVTIPAGAIADVWGNTNKKALHLTYFVGYNSKEEAENDAKLFLTDGINGIMANGASVDVYNLGGAQVKKGATASDLKSLKGVYIVNGKKMLLK